MLLSFSQRNSGIDNNYLTLVSATMENQMTGANSENSNRMIYNINLEAKAAFSIEKISGKINKKNLKGKIIYDNIISDSILVKDGNIFTIRFEKYNMEAETEKYSNPKTCGNEKEHGDEKFNAGNELVFLSVLIENKLYHFKVKCSEKTISGERQLPQ